MRLRERLGAALDERLALMAPSRRLRLALASKVLSQQLGGSPSRLLDVGCGDGLISLAIAGRHPHWQVVGVDLREDALGAARARAQARGLENVRFAAADATRPLPEGNFDAVLALECLLEIPDDRAALGSMSEALRPGGILVVQVPRHDWAPILPGSSSTWRDQVRQGYSPEQLTAALRECGLDPLEIQPTYHAVVMTAQEIRDRIKDRRPAVRATAFPLMAAAVGLERWGLRPGRANALLGVARRPYG